MKLQSKVENPRRIVARQLAHLLRNTSQHRDQEFPGHRPRRFRVREVIAPQQILDADVAPQI